MPLRVGAIYLLIIATIVALVPVWAKFAQAANEFRAPGKILGAFDLQGHRGARGLAPENTLPAFATALSIGVTTLELDLAMTSDGVLVVSHDSRLNPDHTRGPDGAFLDGDHLGAAAAL
jgi:Glycerophosphoryl diester phosphodiesterase family